MANRKDSDYSSTFAVRLRELAAERKLTQKELAELTNLSRQTISVYMSGNNIPDARGIIALCKALEVSADYLLGLTESRTKIDLDIKQISIADLYSFWNIFLSIDGNDWDLQDDCLSLKIKNPALVKNFSDMDFLQTMALNNPEKKDFLLDQFNRILRDLRSASIKCLNRTMNDKGGES